MYLTNTLFQSVKMVFLGLNRKKIKKYSKTDDKS